MHRAKWSIELSLLTCGIILAGMAAHGDVATAGPGDLILRFDEIEAYVLAESPRVHIIRQELAAVLAERDEALRWSNPDLEYEREEVDRQHEELLMLHKHLELPLARSNRRDGWAERVRAAEFGGQAATTTLLAELKTGFVRLRLLDDYLDHLSRFEEVVARTATVAEERHREGELSGVESRLIQLSALSVGAQRRRAQQERGEHVAHWRAEMGIPPEIGLDLATTVVYEPVVLAPAGEYLDLLEGRPGIRARAALQRSLDSQAAAARPSLVPGLDLFGGYKWADPGVDGFVAGIGLSLPLFDRAAGAARQHEAERRIVENEQALTLARLRLEVASLVRLIDEAQPSLADFADHLGADVPLTDALLFSYREGSLALTGLLEAVRIESEALEIHYDQLTTYYGNIFQLEAITGAAIVSFANQGE